MACSRYDRPMVYSRCNRPMAYSRYNRPMAYSRYNRPTALSQAPGAVSNQTTERGEAGAIVHTNVYCGMVITS